MTARNTASGNAAEPGRQAGKSARGHAARPANSGAGQSPDETRQTLDDLRVHQIELEMQNEELRRVQAELNAARARYFELYDLAPVGYVSVNEQGLVLEANLTAATLLGVARSALVNQLLTQFVLKEDQNTYYWLRRQIFATGAACACELRMVKKGGPAFWAHLEVTIAQDAGGAPVWRVVLSDISTLKQVEQALQERIKELHCLYSTSSLLELPGISLDEILARIVMLIPPALQFPEVTGAAIVVGEKIFTTACFRETPWMLACAVSVHGKAVGHVAVCYLAERPARDEGPFLKEERNMLNAIAENIGAALMRKRAEEALCASEEQYRNLFNRMSEGFVLYEILCDEHGSPCDARFLDINPAFEQLTGLTRAQVLGRTFNAVLPGEDPQWIARFGSVALTGEPRHFEHFSQVLGRQYEAYAYRPAPRQCAVLFMDISERQKAEQQMHVALREKGVLLQELYHRVKNNMHLIVAMLNLQSMKLADPAAVQAFKETQDRILSMALVHEKLYKDGNLSQIDLKEYLDDLLPLLSKSCQGESRKVGIATRMVPVPASIDCAIPCGLVVSELVTNAFKHAYPGGRAGTITLALRPTDDAGIELLIADDGVGLPAGYDYRNGSTLGLPSVVALVEHQLAGSIAQVAGAGTAFRILFKEPRRKSRL